MAWIYRHPRRHMWKEARLIQAYRDNKKGLVMVMVWVHAGPPFLAAFLASLVEFVEALTVILAVGAIRGWRGALGGTVVALLVLLAIIIVLGPALSRVPLDLIQVIVGGLLVLFGMRWLRKAILRSVGAIPLHDEDASYAKERDALRRLGGIGQGWDRIAIATSFKITVLEGIEVVFIVIAIGAAGHGLLIPASVGALVALLLVVLLGMALHRPVSSIPENALKFIVGVLLSAFGTFWFGEGLGLAWPGRDWSILALVGGFLAAAILSILLCRKQTATPGWHIGE
jgi:Ca2+/H+ antiporter, TMEM165/GDT1 family